VTVSKYRERERKREEIVGRRTTVLTGGSRWQGERGER
jgi:hypothetical protein